VFDQRLGVIESGKVCPTCKHTNLQCQGHFGHITLARPVYLYQFLDHTVKTLNCVCINCSTLYIAGMSGFNEEAYLNSELKGMERLADIRKQSVDFVTKFAKKENPVCGTCGTQMLKKVEKIQGTVCTLQGKLAGKEEETVALQSEMVLRCFQRMTDNTVKILGFDPKFSHPAWMVCTVLAVPPLTVRPPVMMDDNQRMDDDLSHKLIDIVRNNQELRKQIDKGAPRDYIMKHTEMLEFDVATYVDNDIKGMAPAAQRSGRPLKTLKSRLGAKTGRVRGNLMGKRVDFSARSVITPDANIDVDELGVPEEIARNLTKPEIVTPHNRDRLMSYVRNGTKYPGAKSVFLKEEKRMMSLKYMNPDMIDLHEGDIVHRHMIDGDNVLFNRQPSLHKGSMECHRVKVLPYSTFRLNVSATKPYNADFDGDEMNLHLPQSIAAETELQQLASVLRLIISPRENSPIIQMVQDTLTGAFRISDPRVKIPEHLAMNIMSRLKKPMSAYKRTGADRTGMEVISGAFPLMNFDERVTIKNGQLVKGRLKKGAFNTTSEGVLHVLYNDFGYKRCGQFINEVQSIVTKFNMHTGFSTGASDLISNKETTDFVASTLAQGRAEVRELLANVHSGRFVNISSRENGEELENQIINILKNVSAKISGRVMESLPRDNRLVQMVESGAKGSDLNMTQMVALLGQQIVDGKRIQNTLKDRTLPHFTKFDDGAESRGFVESSFVQGLRPAEYFFHAMGGREGLIDTAVKTSDTGYIQRRMMKTMEDMHVTYDGTVRNNMGTIIQYRYGEDGVESIQVEAQPIRLAIMTLEDIYKMFGLNLAELNPLLVEAVSEAPDLVEDIIADREMLVRDVFMFMNTDKVLAPVHLKRLVEKYRNPYSTRSDLTPAYVVEQLTAIMKEPWIAPNRVFHCLLRYYLAPRRSIIEYRFTKEIFDELIREVRFRYLKSLVHPGEMVGALAAQSVGEPVTQLTLNTFHSAGTVKAGATQGVPRIHELLSVTRNPKNPLNFVYLDSSIAETKEKAIMLSREIQRTTLRDITTAVRMYYDTAPLSPDSVVAEDREILETFRLFSVSNGAECASPWIMRLELSTTEMAARYIHDLVGIQSAIERAGLNILHCVYTNKDVDDKSVVMRIVFPEDVVKDLLTLRFLEERVLDVVVVGIEGVGRVYPREVNKELSWDNATSTYICKKQYVLDVEGTNLYELLVRDDVDPTRTFSNDIHEVYDVFGIEAARYALYAEFTEVFDAAGAYVNYHHMAVLLDSMTYQGRLVSVDRFGIGKHANGVLANSSFEETSKHLFNAAVSAEYDPMQGVSANIMFGQKPPCGTGLVDILLDETRLQEGGEEDTFYDYRADVKARTADVKKKAEEEAGATECKLEDITMW
jgi:DNA-directed RNA polymerase II subunit RPB1